MLGLNCMVQLDYRYSVMAAAMMPIVTIIICFFAFQCAKRSIRTDKLAIMPPDKKLKLVGSLFDLHDYDESDELNISEFNHLLETTCKKGCRSGLKSQVVARQLMLTMGAIQSGPNSSTLNLSREAFLEPCQTLFWKKTQMIVRK